ncbi:MAG: transcriptional repressor LexA [SAR202 cluster bacterium]|nr:transcriptional repressor LexA [SAR202 cluster bacterium]
MKTRKKVSSRQQRMLDFIREFMAETGRPPTVRDIQKACNISSTSVVDYNLRLLQRDGLLRRQPDVARGIELLDRDGRSTSIMPRIPVMGYIAAGQPLPGPASDGWNQEPLEEIEVPRSMVRGHKEMYALRVRGTSMIDAYIDDGDMVIIEPSNDIRNGDMVVAWLKMEQEATLKKIYKEGDQVRLQPANSQMKPIYAMANNVETRGKVVGVLRGM